MYRLYAREYAQRLLLTFYPNCCACYRAMLIRINTVIGILRVYYIWGKMLLHLGLYSLFDLDSYVNLRRRQGFA